MLNLKHVDGFDFDPSKATKQKIIRESTTEIEFLDQFEPTFSTLSSSDKIPSDKMAMGKKAKTVINKVGDVFEIQNIVGIVTNCTGQS